MPSFVRPRGSRGLVVGGMGSLLALSTLVSADASSHREAPLISKDPVADNTDVYAFVDSDDPDVVNLIANFQGFQEPGGGPNYFEFGDDVLYEIKIDNDGDAKEDISYEFRFSTTTRDPNTFLYATGPIASIDDDTWNRPQSYTVTKVEGGRRRVLGTNLLSPPNNVGPRSTPDYESLAAEAVHELKRGGGKVFAGQREEGFFVDIASIFDLGGLRPFNEAHAIPLPEEDGVDTFAGYNVQSIALQVPIDEVVDDDSVIGVWSTASRQAVRVFRGNNGSRPFNAGSWVQVSRLGNPLVNEVVVPLALKDAFNSLEPEDDAKTLTGVAAPPYSTEGDIPLVQDPILGFYIEALYGITPPPAPRNDLVEVFLTGIPGLNQPENVQPAEMLRLNTDTPDASWPNGRQVGDDVVDTALNAVGGTGTTLTDGVQQNDAPYLDTFPYLATPHQGYELENPERVPGNPQLP
jgi:hypothetical protein